MVNKKILTILILIFIIIIININKVFATEYSFPSGSYATLFKQRMKRADAVKILENLSKDDYWVDDEKVHWAVCVSVTQQEDGSIKFNDVNFNIDTDTLGSWIVLDNHEVGDEVKLWLEVELTQVEDLVYNHETGEEMSLTNSQLNQEDYTEDDQVSIAYIVRYVYDEEYDPDKNSWGQDTVLGKISKVIDTVGNIVTSEEAKKFAKNPIGYILTFIYDGLGHIFGDVPMTWAHAISFSNTTLEYSYDELNSGETEDAKEMNEYTKVGAYENEEVSDRQKEINIKLENKYQDEEYRKFSTTTTIPTITVDLYNIAADNIEFFDINFLKIDKNKHKDDNSPWIYLRNFTVTAIHTTFYISAALLITMLILKGIQIVRCTFDNPEKKEEYIKSLIKYGTSLILLIVTVVIMALCIYASNAFLQEVKVNNEKELPIRVNVEEAGYSFSTNITGYFKYMSEIEGIHNYKEKGMYTFIYIVLAITNLGLTAFMDFRIIAMLVLAIVGPILSVLYSLNIQAKEKYKLWVKSYVCLAFIQVFFALVYRLIFEYTL